MPFEAPLPAPQTVAVIGGGISGLGAAWALAADHHVTVFEAENRLGGHARSVMAGQNRDVPVDTGFIVFNRPNYPNLSHLFETLDVPVKPSDMSFAASIDNGRIEYGLRPGALLAQRRNAFRPGFLRMLNDILRFNKQAVRVAQDPDLTLRELMQELRLGEWFQRYYLLPLAGAIWSTAPERIMDFPARSLTQFFDNHALLSARHQHQWMTVDGGSKVYVDKLAADLRTKGATLNLGAPVLSVVRDVSGVTITAKGGVPQRFDQVVFACHSDQALAMLAAPTVQERAVLGALRYQRNVAVLHSDISQMPRRRGCWSSWNYRARQDGDAGRAIGVTYWMNRLQGLDPAQPLFLTLNSDTLIQADLIYDQVTFMHPVFDAAAIAAQAQLPLLQGQNRSYFAGAYARHGFHEDGLASGLDAAARLNAGAVAWAA